MTFQSPKGTRDFFPQNLAALHHIESAWRNASVNAGFDEIEGPTFEHLDLYTVKSGDGIVSELFSFTRAGGDVDYALRPEFTPTLARMAAAKGRSLTLPTKWFGIPSHFRAERPQRGRLREFKQWNVDLLGVDKPSADAEVIATAIHALANLGLSHDDIVVRISHRDVVVKMLQENGVPEDKLPIALTLLDKREKMAPDVFAKKLTENDLEPACFEQFDGDTVIDHEELTSLQDELNAWGISDWCTFDFNIVRGLAYYTGIVFEIHERSGAERAIAGGGRYDKLIEMFGGPSMPAVGFGMGDVVLSLVLKDKKLLGDGSEFLPKPDVFVISAGGDADAHLAPTIAMLRNAGLHARMTYRATRNVGKLLTEAAKTDTRFTLILGEELTRGTVVIKDMNSGEQTEVALSDIVSHITA
ncbi:MAG: histidine--tRNA ligase [Phycisphaerae bacterium]|nr:histidine--tRNA ligase [Phycisphaerae bacterium]|tara:strand:+ start:3559 stop:4803 length:1245 start_codon:yes stop_codon:yes gene_type:complete